MAILQRRTRVSGNSKAAAEPALNAQEIAKVAYELYLKRGCVNGHDLEDWLHAERVVRQRNGRSWSTR